MHSSHHDASRLAFARAHGWRVPPRLAAWWAAAAALGLSTEYLVQPFVWKYWSVGEVFGGWTEVAGSRLVVAACIAVALTLATRAPVQRLRVRAPLVAFAIVGGAAIGEAVLVAINAPGARIDSAAIAGAIVQWTCLSLCAAGLYYLWAQDARTTEAAQASDLSRSTAEDLRLQAELQALRQQIDPHFLFNTLATIKRLKETDADDGAPLLRLLVEYLQSSVGPRAHVATLGHEVDLAQRYLGIVAIRMNGRLAVTIDVPEALRGESCPTLALATLVENAVKHGIGPSDDDGTIAVRARRIGSSIELRVEDTGVGIAESDASVGGHGIGLANVRARLRMMYGERAALALAANEPRGVVASIVLPAAAR